MNKIAKVFTSLILVAVTLLSLLTFGACDRCKDGHAYDGNGVCQICGEKYKPTADPVDDNYRTFYQIFVGSFSDSNNDGIGDIRGIINRMNYLNDGDVADGDSLGVQGLWLSPIFSSPTYHKYDTTDYYEIDWRFGEMQDLKDLIALCHERNVKVILDLVLNHTSNQHEWFTQFKQARVSGDTTNKYYDYYTCVTADQRVGGIAYQKIAGIDGYYECNFDGAMPELNFDNPAVKQEVIDIAKYYLDLGIDGFRFDAVKYIYYGNTAKSVNFWKWYMDELRKIKPDIYCVGECWSGETEVLAYYEAMNCFNFAMSQQEGMVVNAARGNNIYGYATYVESFQDKVLAKNPNGMAMPFLSNHDNDRSGGYFVTDNYSKMAANLYLLTHGSPFIYYGEEIGMRGSRGAANTDANRRLAMLWGDGDLIRDPVGATYSADKQIKTTVADQLKDKNSMLSYYCKVIAIRHKYPAIARGKYNAVTTTSTDCAGFIIEYKDQTLLLLHNTSMEEVTIDLSKCADLTGYDLATLCDYVGVSNANLNGTVLTLGAQTSVIIK